MVESIVYKNIKKGDGGRGSIAFVELSKMQEMIEWHKYPETKPTYSGEFIVQETDQPTARVAWFSNSTKKRRFSALRTRVGQPHHIILWNVIAWAEMPKRYSETDKGILIDFDG